MNMYEKPAVILAKKYRKNKTNTWLSTVEQL